MGDWNFLGGILEEVHIHSTMVGKIWLTVLFIFRMLVLGVAAEDVWNDEQVLSGKVDFICNTQQPGCRNVCYDQAFPVSLIRYWVLQVIFVSSPSLAYMGHAIYRLRALEKERHGRRAGLRRELEALELEQADARRRVERELRQLEPGRLNKAPLRGSLLRTYVAHVMTRSILEVGFMMGQHILYGNQLEPLYRCERQPCPNSVDCFVSRPTEKSMFMVFMQTIAGVSLFLSLMELVHLGYKKLKRGVLAYYTHVKDNLDDYCPNKSKKNSVVQQICVTQGRKATIPTAPVGGYTLLMEKKQANGPSSVPLINSSTTLLYSGANNLSIFKPDPVATLMDSTCAAGAPRRLQRIGSTVMEGNCENDECSASSLGTQQQCDFTAKKKSGSKSDSIGNVSLDSKRSPAPSPKRRISLASSRRDTDLQI